MSCGDIPVHSDPIYCEDLPNSVNKVIICDDADQIAIVDKFFNGTLPHGYICMTMKEFNQMVRVSKIVDESIKLISAMKVTGQLSRKSDVQPWKKQHKK